MANAEVKSAVNYAGIATTVIEVLFASMIMALSAQVAITLPMSPIPVTMQTGALFLISAWLGPKKALLSIGAYLSEGALGLPVFAQGMGGLSVLIGMRAGYLLGFAVAAYAVGLLLQKSRGFFSTILSLAFGSACIYLCGFAWLSIWMGPSQAFFVGIMPFLWGDLLKIVAASSLVHGARRLFCFD